MRPAQLRLLACPACRSELALDEGGEVRDGKVETGRLRCTACAAAYPIVRFIPRFVPLENYASGFGLQWTIHSRTQFDATSGAGISRERFAAETGWPARLEGETILEVGSGSGRFTEPAAATGAMVVSVEYSTAVEANYASNGSRENVLIVQGDIYALPVPPASFDRVFCIGVLQHTPDVERSFRALVPCLKPGGSLVVDVYRKPRGLRRLLATKYLARRWTSRVPPERLYPLTRKYVETMWPLARVISRIPRVGKKLNWMLLIADYRGVYDLTDAQLREWAVLDTFDMLAPRYDTPEDRETLQRWYEDAGMTEIDVRYGYNGVEGRGRRDDGLHRSGGE